MGINGRLLRGNGILINTYYLPQDWIDFIESLIMKYNNLVEHNAMSTLKEKSEVILWEAEPEVMFPEGCDRRPLIINRQEQREMMRPTPESLDLDNSELWNPSYEDFTIQLNDYSDQEQEMRAQISQAIIARPYQREDKSYSYLTQGESENLTLLLSFRPYTLVGKFLVYIAD